MALLLLMLVAAGPPGASGAMEEKRMENPLVWCVCYPLHNTSEHLPCRLEGKDCVRSLELWEKTTAVSGKNCTQKNRAEDFQTLNASLKNDFPFCRGDSNTTIRQKINDNTSFIIVITTLTCSAGVLILILLSVGIMSMIMKNWRNKRIFKKQKGWDNFLFKSKTVHYQPDAIYSNVINLVAQKEDDFAIYANVPCFQLLRKVSPVVTYAPDQMEHASVVYL
ncbi:uncharacterized protein LOC111720422 [Sarcophilus harrisii]|uniref:uncharacterized protein LOC111720422 n=1 Tax=Sarcophilus harrisii TaxID=9305 RepID=UPI000C7994F7|nr:uncharacterized protein LOC111720422 [Sarcophilus harrisii]